MRVSTIVVLSIVLGVIIGLVSVNAVNRLWNWHPELEMQKDAARNMVETSKNLNPNAKIEVKETVFDFDIMHKKEKGKHEFEVKNIGTETLTLEPNQKTCQCTSIEVSKKQLAPGETGHVILTWDSERAESSFHQQATILTNDPDNQEIFFTIKGLFIFPIIIKPDTINFPVIYSGNESEMPCRIFGFEKEPALAFESIDWSDKEHFEFVLTPSELTENDQKDKLNQNAKTVFDGKLKVKSGLPLGPFQEKIVLKSNYISEPVVEILVRGQISGGNLSVIGKGYLRETGVFDLGTLSRNGYEQTITLMFTGASAADTNIDIKEVYPEWMKAEIVETVNTGEEVRKGRRITLKLAIPAGSPPGNFADYEHGKNAKLVLSTNNPSNPVVVLPILFNMSNQ